MSKETVTGLDPDATLGLSYKHLEHPDNFWLDVMQTAHKVGWTNGDLAKVVLGFKTDEHQPEAWLIDNLFVKAAYEAEMAFEPAFDGEGKPREGKDSEFKAAQDAPQILLPNLMKEANEITGSNFTLDGVTKEAGFASALAIVEGILGKKIEGDLDNDEVIKSLETTFEDEKYFHKVIPVIEANEGERKDPQKLAQIELALRLANVMWAAGQGFKAKWKNEPQRIDPEQTDNYRPFDAMVWRIYKKTLDKSKKINKNDAILRAVFEVYKDLLIIQGFDGNVEHFLELRAALHPVT